jgi:hypothetical protein
MSEDREEIPEAIRALCAKVTAKRARTVIDHILKHGFITTEELKDAYGYDHPPRAVRDVRENGIPITTFKVRSKASGRMIAAYKFDDPAKIQGGRIGGRSAFSKNFKEEIIDRLGPKCTLTSEILEPRYLQIDHRIPYQVAGETASDSIEAFMLLDASSQRAKSWSCEHCENFTSIRDPDICRCCFWAYPEDYDHVAMKPERRLHLVWQGAETEAYDALESEAEMQGDDLHELVKKILVRHALKG